MKKPITITIDEAILERLQKMAEDEQRSLSGLINRLLTKVLKVIEPSKGRESHGKDKKTS